MSVTQMFRVPLSQVEGRLDPHFYQDTYQVLIERISTTPHQRLRDLCQFSKEIWDGESDFDHEFPYLEISEIDLSTGWFDAPKKIPIVDAPSRARMKIRHGDFLVSLTRPNRGAIARSEKEHPPLFIASTGFAVLRDIAIETVNPDYFFHALRSRIVLDQFEQRSSGGNYPAITEEEMGRVLIPLPDPGTQEHIAGIMRQAHAQKARLESEAKVLLNSVDAVLYRHLGIDPAAIKVDSIHERVFKTRLSQVTGRFDPYANHPQVRQWIHTLKKGDYASYSLNKLVHFKKDIVSSIPEEMRYVGLENISGMDGSLTETTEKSEVNSALIFETGNVLFSKLRPNLNKTHLAMKNGVCSTEFHVLQTINISANYLTAYLRCGMVVSLLAQLVTGNTLPRLQTEDVLRLPVITPSLKTQQKIITEISAIQIQAQTLRQQAQASLAQAKQQVEQMILGDFV